MHHSRSELLFQRRIQELFSDSSRSFVCTNGDVVQILTSGMVNVYEGPDFTDTAVLHNGVVYIGNSEVHFKASDFTRHGHHTDSRYASLLLHIVKDVDDATPCARWTLQIDADALDGISVPQRVAPMESAVEELQRHALLRLLRTTAEAQATIRRIGVRHTFEALYTTWLDKYYSRRRRPGIPPDAVPDISDALLYTIVLEFERIQADEVHAMLNRALHERSECLGASLRQEVLVNVSVPICCAIAPDPQRVALLQWYWAAKSAHPYGKLRRRFPDQRQDFVWQQQGMLELIRGTSTSASTYGSTCGEIIRSYGLDPILNFLRCVHAA